MRAIFAKLLLGLLLTYGAFAEDADCKDNNADCPGWAADGECDKNPGFMAGECRLSCGICKPPETTTTTTKTKTAARKEDSEAKRKTPEVPSAGAKKDSHTKITPKPATTTRTTTPREDDDETPLGDRILKALCFVLVHYAAVFVVSFIGRRFPDVMKNCNKMTAFKDKPFGDPTWSAANHAILQMATFMLSGSVALFCKYNSDMEDIANLVLAFPFLFALLSQMRNAKWRKQGWCWALTMRVARNTLNLVVNVWFFDTAMQGITDMPFRPLFDGLLTIYLGSIIIENAIVTLDGYLAAEVLAEVGLGTLDIPHLQLGWKAKKQLECLDHIELGEYGSAIDTLQVVIGVIMTIGMLWLGVLFEDVPRAQSLFFMNVVKDFASLKYYDSLDKGSFGSIMQKTTRVTFVSLIAGPLLVGLRDVNKATGQNGYIVVAALVPLQIIMVYFLAHWQTYFQETGMTGYEDAKLAIREACVEKLSKFEKDSTVMYYGSPDNDGDYEPTGHWTATVTKGYEGKKIEVEVEFPTGKQTRVIADDKQKRFGRVKAMEDKVKKEFKYRFDVGQVVEMKMCHSEKWLKGRVTKVWPLMVTRTGVSSFFVSSKRYDEVRAICKFDRNGNSLKERRHPGPRAGVCEVTGQTIAVNDREYYSETTGYTVCAEVIEKGQEAMPVVKTYKE